MFGYIFEITNNKTGEKYLGKRYGVTFDKKYLGEDVNEKLAVAIEKYGRPSFVAKMIMPYESKEAIDAAFAEMQPVTTKKVVVKGTPDVVEDDKMTMVEEKVVEEKPKRRSKKKVEE